MQRMRRPERGAVAVITAIALVVMMGVSALAIDVSAMHVDRQRLQTGADAAALAVAQDCARDACDLAVETTEWMASANLDQSTGGVVEAIDSTAGTVTVRVSRTREHAFAPVMGINETPISARASARWGYPTGGVAVLPVAFSWCELMKQAGITPLRDPATNKIIGVNIPETTPEHTIYLTKSSRTDCTGPSNNMIPGGFGWLAPEDGSRCSRTISRIGDPVDSAPGNSPPSNCETQFPRWIGQTILLPIFDKSAGTGAGGSYQVFGYVAFTLKSYYFAGLYKPAGAPCSGDERCIRGSFDRFVDLSENFSYSPSGPRLGAAVVALTD